MVEPRRTLITERESIGTLVHALDALRRDCHKRAGQYAVDLIVYGDAQSRLRDNAIWLKAQETLLQKLVEALSGQAEARGVDPLMCIEDLPHEKLITPGA